MKNLFFLIIFLSSMIGFAQDSIVAPLKDTYTSPQLNVLIPDTNSIYSKKSVESMLASSNNNCTGMVQITSTCIDFNNSGNNLQTGENISCDAVATRSCWGYFQATATNNFLRAVYITSTATYFTPYCAIYGPFTSSTGNCLPSSANQLYCQQMANLTNDIVMSGLIVGDYYLVQWLDYGGATGTKHSTFCLSLMTPTVCNSCSSTCGSISTYTSAPASFSSEIPHYSENAVVSSNVLSSEQCFNFTANNTSENINMGSSTEGSFCGFSQFNWSIYNSSCTLVSSGTISNLVVNGLTCGANYVLCVTYETNCQTDSIAPYVYNSNCAGLPITLVSFNAQYNQLKNEVSISWETASESNNKEFIIQKTQDGNIWNVIDSVPGADNSSQDKYYSIVDKEPYSGISYYRLIQKDFDGNETNFQPIAVTINSSSVSYSQNQITILNTKFENAEIIDMTGRIIIDTENPVIDISSLSNSMYILKINNEFSTEIRKFVK